MNKEELDVLISKLKDLLRPLQLIEQNYIEKSKWPIGFIVGNPRSGTTLLLQWLATLGCFSYPTNFLNRFAYAPYIGALIQELIYNDETGNKIFYKSELGKTKNILDVNEFQFLFRNYINKFFPEYLQPLEIEHVNFTALKKDFALIEKVFKKPYVMKGMLLQYNIEDLFQNIPNSIFIYIKRNPIYIMQSIYSARKKYSDINNWWSCKPKEYEELQKFDIYHQIAGQVFFTDKSIKTSLKKLPQKNYIITEYENFCNDPAYFYNSLIKKYNLNGCVLPFKYYGEKQFSLKNNIKLDIREIDKFNKAFLYFETNY